MHPIANTITERNLEEELKNSYLDYAMSVIVGRALPDIRDGLKPVHRRILFAMNELHNYWNKSYKKSARIVGHVIGKYHPHGDTAVYDSIVRLAQPFSMKYPLIDGQGNFGSIDGDSAAAMRYTEIRLSRIANELLLDLEKNTVNYILNYDNSEKLPEVMPTRIPNLLINGSSGIAVGMATNIPPHNLSEIINGCLAYIQDSSISLDQLMQIIKGPDFPTAAIIHGTSGIEEAYRTGKGKIYLRGRSKVEVNNHKECIIITEIPYQVNKAKLIERIAELVKEKRIEEINSLRDESDQDGIRIVLELKKDAIKDIVLNNLYSLSQLQISYHINMVALHHGKPCTLSLKEMLSAFIQHRREVVTRRTHFELNEAKNKIHILEALILALTDIDLIIYLIKSSNNSTTAVNKLINYSWNIYNINKILNLLNNKKLSNFSGFSTQINHEKFFFTETQAKAILNLRLQKLTNLEYKSLLNEYENLLTEIINLTNILDNSQSLMNVISEELKLIKKQYHSPRKTEINKNFENFEFEDLISKKDVVVTLSYQGYVKSQPLTDYEAQHRGGKGKLAASIKEEDFIYRLLVANTHDTILLFSSKGRIYWMKVYQLPLISRCSRGRPINNFLPLEKKERITAILPVRSYDKGCNVFMATTSGIVKKTLLSEFSRPRNSGIIAVNLNEGGELIGVNLTNGNDEVMLFSAFGKVVRFMENQVRSMGRTASGVQGMKLAKGDRIVSLIIPNGNVKILTLTQNGYGKRTLKSEFPTKSRATKGVISIKVSERNGEVVGSVQVNDDDQVMMITDGGNLVRIRVSEVSIVGRNTKGVTLIRTTENENVVGLQRIVINI